MISPGTERARRLPGAAPVHIPSMVERLRQSAIFREYQRAFQATTGLPLSLQPPGALGLAHVDTRHQNAFCLLMTGHGKSCSACLEAQRNARELSGTTPATVICHAGLGESCVPVRHGATTLAFLHVGQVLLHPPSPSRFAGILGRLAKWGVPFNPSHLEAAYFGTRLVERDRYEAMLRLLAIFAGYLSILGDQLAIACEPVETPMISRAKAFIAEHADEALSLGVVARAVNTSSFYFCKVFRRSTGLKFVDYVGRVRVERVKRLLLDPRSNISEAAYRAGFTSLSQFNRIFKRVVGEEPRAWRSHHAAG